MEKLILEQLVKVSEQIGELKVEMREGFKRQDEKIEARFKEQDEKIEARFKEQDEKFDARFKEQDEKFDARFKEQDKEIVSLRAEMKSGFKQQSERTDKLEHTLKENLDDISGIFNDIFRILSQHANKIINLEK